MKSIFLVKTPLQLLNAIEAKHHFKLNKENCILVVMGDRKNLPQMQALERESFEWGVVVFLNEVPLLFGNLFGLNTDSWLDRLWKSKFFSKSVFNVRRLNRISKAISEAEYIFIGYARYIYMRHFVNVTPHKNVCLLDDGNATIQDASDRSDGETKSNRKSIKYDIKTSLKKKLLGVDNAESESLLFFTMYDVMAGPKDSVVKNEYSYIRSKLKNDEETNDVYFLGGPLPGANIISKESYIDHLTRVKKYFSDKKIIYVAHRRESQSFLNELSEELDLEVVLFDYPVEYQFAMLGPRPKIMASFVSSALDSCRSIFKDKMKIISFRLDLEGSLARGEFEKIYKNFESNSNENFLVEKDY